MKTTLTTTLIVLFVLGLGIQVSQADVMALYQFSGASAASTDGNADTLANNWTIVNGTPDCGGDTDIGISGYANNAYIRSPAAPSPENAATAVDDDDYWAFTVAAANAGNVLNLQSLDFTAYFTNDGSAPSITSATFYIQSNVDGFGSGNTIIDSVSITNTSSPYSVDLSDAKFQGLSSIELRFYIADSDGNVGDTIRVDNVTLNGTVGVPEPASMTMILLGTGALVFRRRRK